MMTNSQIELAGRMGERVVGLRQGGLRRSLLTLAVVLLAGQVAQAETYRNVCCWCDDCPAGVSACMPLTDAEAESLGELASEALDVMCEPLRCTRAYCQARTCGGTVCPSDETGQCGDGIDNDADERTDCDEEECTEDPSCHPTPTPTNTPTRTRTPRPVSTPGPCRGDCNQDGEVTVDELMRGVNIALAYLTVDQCHEFDPNLDGTVTIDELIQAVTSALYGCVGA